MTDPYDQLDNRLDTLRANAEQVRSRYEDEARDIEQDVRLSDEGRKDTLDAARKHAQDQLDTLKKKEETTVDDAINTLERSLFGFTSYPNHDEVRSRRDAEERADRIENTEEALMLLSRAERANDGPLAQAIVRLATERGYQAVITAYDSKHPGTGAKLTALSRIRQATAGGDYTMGRALAYRVSAF